MNANDLLAALRTMVRNMLSDIRLPQKGLVTSYDPTKHMAKVMLKPQELETSWLQICSMGVGQGFGWTSGLKPGDEVMVAFEGGDINSGVITGCLYNGQDLPTLTNSGETKFIHPSGSSIKFFADGTIELIASTALVLGGSAITFVGSAAGGAVLSVNGPLVMNAQAFQSFGPSIPGAPTFNPTVHATALAHHADT